MDSTSPVIGVTIIINSDKISAYIRQNLKNFIKCYAITGFVGKHFLDSLFIYSCLTKIGWVQLTFSFKHVKAKANGSLFLICKNTKMTPRTMGNSDLVHNSTEKTTK